MTSGVNFSYIKQCISYIANHYSLNLLLQVSQTDGEGRQHIATDEEIDKLQKLAEVAATIAQAERKVYLAKQPTLIYTEPEQSEKKSSKMDRMRGIMCGAWFAAGFSAATLLHSILNLLAG